MLASWTGFESVHALIEGKSSVMIGIEDKKITFTSFDDAINKKKHFNFGGLELARILAL